MSRIHDYVCLDHIILVDNASTDNSCENLLKLRDEKVEVIRSGKNGGYGFGNNLGVRYAEALWQATHVLIANPDVSFTEDCVKKLAKVFEKHPDVGVAAAVMEDPVYGRQINGWRLHGFAGELLSMGPVSRRLLRGFLNYPKGYFRGKKAVYVDAVHGSMLMADTKSFLDCGGYDEGIFLYQEEAVLGQRMRAAGRRTVLLLNCGYSHEHSASISKSYDSLIARQKLRHESVMYYMKKYLKIAPWQEAFARLWFAGILMEIRAAGLAAGKRL